jgi:plasmid stabilization system protein ParE
LKVEFLPEAFDELQHAVSYLNQEHPGAGDRFESAFWKAIDSICDAPDAWQRASRRTRRKIIRRFGYGVVYSVARGQLLIVAVMHLYRKPNYWRDRLS